MQDPSVNCDPSAADSLCSDSPCARLIAVCAAFFAFLGTAVVAAPVEIASGLLQGVGESDVTVYRGVPFAAPPVGALRWRPPEPPQAWSGVRTAERFAAICPQQGAYPPESPPETMSEDCLYLNVWVPERRSSAPLPVMVWIYGGGLENGSASTPLYFGDRLAGHGVIVVTANYRLGALGFLSLPALRRESGKGVSGNYGLLDQIAALQWVHRNIGAFGGDPANVTIFGQSSGSISVSALVASPLAKGLFQRAIGQSGGLFEPIELAGEFWPAGAEVEGERFAERSGAKTLANLRRLSSAELLKTPFNPHFVVDGFVLPQPPFDAYRDRAHNDVDVLVGMNSDEGQFFLADKTVDLGNFGQILAADFSAPLVWLTRPSPGVSDTDARTAAAAFEGDMRFRWDMWTWARLAARNGSRNVYFYQFSHSPPFPAGHRYFGMGATHGMEMPYVFGHLDDASTPWNASDHRLAETMSAYWSNFAKTGDPNGSGLANWTGFRSSRDTVMILGEPPRQDALPNATPLRRIDRIYTAVRWVSGHRYLVLAITIIVVVALLASLWVIGRRWWNRRGSLQRRVSSTH